MTERLVAWTRDGRLRLYATNGDSTHEVASMEVGELDDATAVTIAAALTDLRAIVNAKQPRPARDTKPRALPTRRRQLREHVHDDLSGLVLDHLRAHGTATAAQLVAALQPEATHSSSPAKRVSNALYHLRASGVVTGPVDLVWSAVDRGDT